MNVCFGEYKRSLKKWSDDMSGPFEIALRKKWDSWTLLEDIRTLTGTMRKQYGKYFQKRQGNQLFMPWIISVTLTKYYMY